MPWVGGRAIFAHPARIMRQMIGRVPTVLGRVDAAAKGQRIVGHDDLLVVTGAKGVMPVQGEMDPVTTKQAQRQRGHQPPRRGQHGPVPFQQVDMQLRRPLDHRLYEGTELIGIAVRRIAVLIAFARQHLKFKVEIPADQHQLLPRAEKDLAQDTEVIRCIDDKAKTLSPRDAPCGLIGKQALARCRVSRMLLVRLR